MIYAIWRSSVQCLHIKDTRVGDRFEDWWYGNALDHSAPVVWDDINRAYEKAHYLMSKHGVKAFTYQVKEFEL